MIDQSTNVLDDEDEEQFPLRALRPSEGPLSAESIAAMNAAHPTRSIAGMRGPMGAPPAPSIAGGAPIVPPEKTPGPLDLPNTAEMRGPNLQQDVLAGKVAPPEWKDYKPAHVSAGRRILAALVAGTTGMRDPALAAQLGRSITSGPQLEKFGEDTQQYNDTLGEGQRVETQGRQEKKDEEAEKLEESEINKNDADASSKKNPPAKTGTPQEDTLHDLMTGNNGQPRINPDTKQPYTYLEAYGTVNAAGPGAKKEGTLEQQYDDAVRKGDTARANQIKTELKDLGAVKTEGKPPSDEEGAISDYLKANHLESTPENRLKARAALRPSYQGGAQTQFDRSSAEAASKDVETARGGDFRYRSMAGSYPRALKGDQQAQINILMNHIGMTLGLQRGARITKDAINGAMDSSPWLAQIKARYGPDAIEPNKNGTSLTIRKGVVLTPEQMQQMMALATQQRATAWSQAVESARQAGVADKLKIPGDVRIKVTDQNGKPGTIPGGQLAAAEDEGYTVAAQ